MDTEGKFWLGVWSIVAVTLVSLATVIAVSSQATNDKLLAMAQAGADPIAANCSLTGFGGNSGDTAVCAVIAAKGQHNEH